MCHLSAGGSRQYQCRDNDTRMGNARISTWLSSLLPQIALPGRAMSEAQLPAFRFVRWVVVPGGGRDCRPSGRMPRVAAHGFGLTGRNVGLYYLCGFTRARTKATANQLSFFLLGHAACCSLNWSNLHSLLWMIDAFSVGADFFFFRLRNVLSICN